MRRLIFDSPNKKYDTEFIITRNYKHTDLMNNQQFPNIFLETFSHLPAQFLLNYSEQIHNYHRKVIPFESALVSEEGIMSLKTHSLQRQKKQLQQKIQSLNSLIHRQESEMENHSYRITDLQNTVAQLERAYNDNLSVAQVLKISIKEMQCQLGEVSSKVKKAEEEKKDILGLLETKKNQYNALLEGYMRDKNVIAEKLNYMNELETSLIEKEKHIKDEQIYLKKQWQQLQAHKSQKQRPKIFKTQSQPTSPQVNNPITTNALKSETKPDQVLRTPKKKLIKHHNAEIYQISSSSQSNLIATCGSDRLIKIYDAGTLENLSIIKAEEENQFLSICMDNNGKRVLAGGANRSAVIYQTQSGKQLHKFAEHNLKVNSVTWFERDKFISGSEDKYIKVWSIQKLESLYSISTGRPVKCLSCRQNQPLLYSGHSDGSVRLYSPSQASPVSQIKGLIDRSINSIWPLSNQSQILVSSQEGSPVHILDLKMNKSIGKYEGQDYCNSSGKSLASALQKYVIAGNCDGYIYYWNRESMKFDRKVGGHDYGVTGLARLNGGLVSGDNQGNIIIWSI